MKFYELFIALRYIKANLKQSIIIVTAISIGVAIIIWIPSINLSFMEDLINRTVSSVPNITIQKELDTLCKEKELRKENQVALKQSVRHLRMQKFVMQRRK